MALALIQLGAHLVNVDHRHRVDATDARHAAPADGRVAPVADAAVLVAISEVAMQVLVGEVEPCPRPRHQRRTDVLVEQRAERALDLVTPYRWVEEGEHAHGLDSILGQLARAAARWGRAMDAAGLERTPAEAVHARHGDAKARRDDLRLVRVVHDALPKPGGVAGNHIHAEANQARPRSTSNQSKRYVGFCNFIVKK
jgi:hypothetical protein